jgi:hypothetical protein
MDGKQMPEGIKVPDIIDVKIGSKLEAKWTEVLNKTEEALVADEINTKLNVFTKEANQKMMDLAKTKIAEEREKFK